VRTTFSPDLAFGAAPGAAASFTLTASWRQLRGVLENDAAWWEGPAAAAGPGGSEARGLQPFLMAELGGAALSVRMLQE
jgi:hypothetical protein